MKRLLFVTMAICTAIIASSQNRSTTTGGNPASSTGQPKLINGDVYLHTVNVKGKQKIYATYVNGKVTGHFALDSNGKRNPARIMTKADNSSARKLKCYTCVKVVDADTGKIAETCTEVTCPDSITGEKSAIRTAQ